MNTNVVIEQYGKFKKEELDKSPYKCLCNSKIMINPHQVNAFCAAVKALPTGGIVLADEVGLGKTIEAGLTLKYVLAKGAKRVLIVLPSTLRKQWEIELKEKFDITTSILNRNEVFYNKDTWRYLLNSCENYQVVITSYDFSSKLIDIFPNVKWDFVIIDEAHNLRNVFHGAQRARKLYEKTKGIPKVLLTATPLQNRLSDLHGIISYIDPRIFGAEKVFNKRFSEGRNYKELKRELRPVLHRTLRRDVAQYMHFSKRICKTIDFTLTKDEMTLYTLVNNFLKNDQLYCMTKGNKALIVLVIRKLLASSSYALVETFEVFKTRLEKLLQGTKSSSAQDGFDLFWSFVEDEMDEEDLSEPVDDDLEFQKEQMRNELNAVNRIIEAAKSVKSNAKIEALFKAVETGLKYQAENDIPEKIVVFTESKRTQLFIAEKLRQNGYDKEDIVIFNGDMSDSLSKEIYKTWQIKNYGNNNYGRAVEYKHAIVDYFKNHAKVLIVTDVGSEGLNLQFCNTVINYDLPWNPQKIEQRIGRCHRYGQQYDVVAINLLNTQNVADKRVYDILTHKFDLFNGVFGASDVALGTLESGLSFEKEILEIYQSCNSTREFTRAFDKLDRRLDARRNNNARQLQSILETESKEMKIISLANTKVEIKRYLEQVQFWGQVKNAPMDNNLYYWKDESWGEKYLRSHGSIFLGALCTDKNETLFPVIAAFDENGKNMNLSEDEIIALMKEIDDIDVHSFKPTKAELDIYSRVYDSLRKQVVAQHYAKINPVIAYNKKKIDNWVEVRNEQLTLDIEDLKAEIDEMVEQEHASKNIYEKADIRKKTDIKRRALEKKQNNFWNDATLIQKEAQRAVDVFNKQFEMTPILNVNVVLKF